MAKSSGGKAKKQPGPFRKVVARNKRARRDYFIEDTWEAGIVLTGSEVKTLRAGKASIQEAYARIRGGEAWLFGCTVPEYAFANRLNHEPGRERKLLLHAHEIKRMHEKTRGTGMTIVALELYFDERGKVKVEIGLARGKRLYDKRQTVKQADADRAIARARKR